MSGLVVLAIVVFGIIVAGVATKRAPIAFAAAAVLGVAGTATLTFNQVEEGNAAVPITFGRAGEAVGPGVHFVAPWTKYVEFSTREQVIKFEGDAPEREALGLDDITMQTEGGGGFDLDARVRVALPEAAATQVWKELGQSYNDSVVVPASRECLRDSAVGMSLTDAITSKRPQIAALAETCLIEKLTMPYGIRVIGVELGGTTLPAEVQDSINAKQGAEQERQAALIGLDKSRIDAQRQSVEAKATSDAEQIIACGATVVKNDEGVEIIVPNEECEDQFSDEYLDWLWIQNMKEIDTLVVVGRDITDANTQLILDTAPSP